MTYDLSRLRYTRLGYVAVNVSDPAASARFYEDVVGLEAVGVGPNGEPLLRCSDSHHDVMLCKSEEPGLKRVSWLLESEDAFAFAKEHLQKLGLSSVIVAPAETEALGLTAALRFREPTIGVTFEFAWGAKAAAQPYQKKHTAIARLGHIVVSSPNRLATEKFLTDSLNFRVSDRITDGVSFMRCFPNPFHHSFGVSQGGKAGLNHINFMVTEIDDIGRGIYRAKRAGSKIVFGPGRHPPSESIFLYFLDPDGLTLEYSFGMEEFSEIGAREPRDLPFKLESIDYWGAVPEPEFGATGKIEEYAQSA